MLFMKKKKPAAPKPKQTQPKVKVIWSKEFVQSPSFRGFRKIVLNRYRHEAVDETINKMKRAKYDISNSTIRLDLVEAQESYSTKTYQEVRIYIDGMFIGSVFKSDNVQFPMLTEYEFDKVHIRIEDSSPDEIIENVVTARAFLFVHYIGTEPVKVTIK